MDPRPPSPPPEQPPGAPKLSRRSHRKSRTGCGNCKKRRIKCDEAKPGCKNCASFRVPCDYSGSSSGLRDAPLERARFVISGGPLPRGKRGRPRTRWETEEQPDPSRARESASSQTSIAFRTVHRSPPIASEHVEELRLLHYYTAKQSQAVGSDAHWIDAPTLGFSYPFVLHLVYEHAALDYARLQPPERRQRYYSLAARYSTLGLQGVSNLLPRLDFGNCHAIYTAAVFTCINVFARGPQPGEYLLFNDRGPPQWLSLLRGVRTITEMVGMDKIASGPQGDKPVESAPMATQPIAAALKLPHVDWIGHFDRLQAFVATSSAPDATLNAEALYKLRLCYEATYGGADGNYHGDANHQNMFIWAYQMEDEFATSLQEKRPMALVIFAHFALLLKNVDSIWFLEGWAEHIITGVQRCVDETHRAWLRWPTEQIEMLQREKERRAGCRADAGRVFEIED